MKSKKRIAAVSLAATCALAGAAAGIAQSTAATKSKSTTKKSLRHSAAGFPGGPRGGMGGFGGPGGRAVHEVEAVLNKAGTAYISQTVEVGEITAVDASAGTITLKEGTSTVTYATPTITIPSDATVTLDGASSSLEKLKAGDHATIASSSEGTTVFATDSSFTPGDGHGHGGPPPGMPNGQAPPSEG